MCCVTQKIITFRYLKVVWNVDNKDDSLNNNFGSCQTSYEKYDVSIIEMIGVQNNNIHINKIAKIATKRIIKKCRYILFIRLIGAVVA